MASNYAQIREENEKLYGTDIGRIGRLLLSDRYADRTHFISELLQNAKDALRRRRDWKGSRAIRFRLSKTELRVSHFGQPFDEKDVRAICGIALTTKDLTSIGRFGIGFKSVYAFTDRPEIHSGEEDFTIETFVWPKAVPPIDRDPDETVIILPLRPSDPVAGNEITRGLRQLGPETLLFLRQIDELRWSVDGGASGRYLRSKPEVLGENVRRVTVLGETDGEPQIRQTWLVFERQVSDGHGVACVELAFSLAQDEGGSWSVQPVSSSPLVVFFPTLLPTYLGFLIQGPYRTTPSRDNVPG